LATAFSHLPGAILFGTISAEIQRRFPFEDRAGSELRVIQGGTND
jgi:hypothetical protein